MCMYFIFLDLYLLSAFECFTWKSTLKTQSLLLLLLFLSVTTGINVVRINFVIIIFTSVGIVVKVFGIFLSLSSPS